MILMKKELSRLHGGREILLGIIKNLAVKLEPFLIEKNWISPLQSQFA
jgi:hypothetical protein